ncbi:OsmC family protein [Cronobacter turicensis]|nr:OsmC family protein [Cronobacter turicensis]
MQNDIATLDIITTWRGGMASVARCAARLNGEPPPGNTVYSVLSDEPVALGGQGMAPSPQELLLAAFNACMMAAFVSAAGREHIHLTRLRIETRGTLHLTVFDDAQPAAGISPDTLCYAIVVSGEADVSQFDKLHRRVIASSPNRWLLSQNMVLKDDLIVE